jgi:hypothetical protein
MPLPACTPHPDSGARDDSVPADTAAPLDGLRGGVQLLEMQSDQAEGVSPAAWVWGLYDRPMVGQIFGVVWSFHWEIALEEGECAFVDVMREGTCDPACATDQYCSREDRCEPWPTFAPAGDLTLSGLTEPLTLTPTERGEYLAVDLPDDLFDPGAAVTLRAEGGATPAFEVAATAPAPGAESPDCGLAWTAGEPLTITWTPGSDDARVRWEMISLMHAGNGPLVLCESDDDGSIVVPGAITAAYEPWRTDWETWQLSRFGRGEVALSDGGSVALELAAQRVCFRSP